MDNMLWYDAKEMALWTTESWINTMTLGTLIGMSHNINMTMEKLKWWSTPKTTNNNKKTLIANLSLPDLLTCGTYLTTSATYSSKVANIVFTKIAIIIKIVAMTIAFWIPKYNVLLGWVKIQLTGSKSRIINNNGLNTLQHNNVVQTKLKTTTSTTNGTPMRAALVWANDGYFPVVPNRYNCTINVIMFQNNANGITASAYLIRKNFKLANKSIATFISNGWGVQTPKFPVPSKKEFRLVKGPLSWKCKLMDFWSSRLM